MLFTYLLNVARRALHVDLHADLREDRDAARRDLRYVILRHPAHREAYDPRAPDPRRHGFIRSEMGLLDTTLLLGVAIVLQQLQMAGLNKLKATCA